VEILAAVRGVHRTGRAVRVGLNPARDIHALPSPLIAKRRRNSRSPTCGSFPVGEQCGFQGPGVRAQCVGHLVWRMPRGASGAARHCAAARVPIVGWFIWMIASRRSNGWNSSAIPNEAVAFDNDGRTAINWGVYGAPETFLGRHHGQVIYNNSSRRSPRKSGTANSCRASPRPAGVARELESRDGGGGHGVDAVVGAGGRGARRCGGDRDRDRGDRCTGTAPSAAASGAASAAAAASMRRWTPTASSRPRPAGALRADYQATALPGLPNESIADSNVELAADLPPSGARNVAGRQEATMRYSIS